MTSNSPTEEFKASREVRFLNRQETRFPHLLRLCMDFSFRVLETVDQSALNKRFLLVTDDYRHVDIEAISPFCDSLTELDSYVASNMVDILHDYLFGLVDEDIKMAEGLVN